MIFKTLFNIKTMQSGIKYPITVIKNQIKLTEACIKQINRKTKTRPDSFLRLGVNAGEGCAGFSYKFSFDNKLTDSDFVVQQDSKTIFAIDDTSIHFLKGSEVDFVSDLMSQSFQIKSNPNADQSCSCKTSFSPKPDVLKKL